MMPQPNDMDPLAQQIVANLQEVRQKIAAAARSAGRDPAEIRLIAVTKTHPAATVLAAIRAGLREFGENYVQEAKNKAAEVTTSDNVALQWHLIGHLQSNKAKYSVELFSLIQSVDNYQLAQELNKRAANIGKTQRVLVEVRLAEVAGRAGVGPENALALCAQIAALPNLALDGLMGIAPTAASFAQDSKARTALRVLRALWEQLPGAQRQILSLGMSNDYEAAIAEGANLVRIGSALFGPRPNQTGGA